MTKLIPVFIEGKKWIQLSQLSEEQAKSLKSLLPMNYIRNFFFQGVELNDCLEYDTYEYWFKSQQISGQLQALLDF
jgi:hypothetical protein